MDRETGRCARWNKEAIWIRKAAPTMKRNEGGHMLTHTWDSELAIPPDKIY